MKRALLICLLLLCMVLSACAEDAPTAEFSPPPADNQALPPDAPVFAAVQPMGQVPEALRSVVENNLFYTADAFDGRLLRTETLPADNHMLTHRVWMMDPYGAQSGAFTCQTEEPYRVSFLTATADGGFLLVLGFTDYADENGVMMSERGFASRIIKCRENGEVRFDTALENVASDGLRYCIEKDGKFYFFGTTESPAAKVSGVSSPTDIYMAVLDGDGTLLRQETLGGSDYDFLSGVLAVEDGFALWTNTQSNDGDFADSGSVGYPVQRVVMLSGDLVMTDLLSEWDMDFAPPLGYLDGQAVTAAHPLLRDFDGGSPTAVVDYGSFYLIVSHNVTGRCEQTPPMFNGWYYTETVYSAYDLDHRLLFRGAVDSSPDFDVTDS